MEDEELTLDSLVGGQEQEAPRETVRDALEAATVQHSSQSQDLEIEEGGSGAVTAEEAGIDRNVQAAEIIEAPKHWSKEDRELFAKQPRDAQEWLLARHKAMEGDNTRVSQQLAEQMKWREPIEKIFEPYSELMKQHNLTPAAVLQNYINAEQQLTNDPVRGLLMLAQRYKVNPIDLVAAAEGGAFEMPAQVDPALKALQDELATIRGDLQSRDRAAREEEARQMGVQISEFAESKGSDGQLLYPHIGNQQVRDMMSMLIGTGQVDVAKAGGVVPALKQAYEQAVYAIPETRQALVKSLVESQTKEAAEAQRRKVAKAKNVGVSVSGSSAMSAAPAVKGSVRSHLEAAAREQGLIS